MYYSVWQPKTLVDVPGVVAQREGNGPILNMLTEEVHAKRKLFILLLKRNLNILKQIVRKTKKMTLNFH